MISCLSLWCCVSLEHSSCYALLHWQVPLWTLSLTFDLLAPSHHRLFEIAVSLSLSSCSSLSFLLSRWLFPSHLGRKSLAIETWENLCKTLSTLNSKYDSYSLQFGRLGLFRTCQREWLSGPFLLCVGRRLCWNSSDEHDGLSWAVLTSSRLRLFLKFTFVCKKQTKVHINAVSLTLWCNTTWR